MKKIIFLFLVFSTVQLYGLDEEIEDKNCSEAYQWVMQLCLMPVTEYPDQNELSPAYGGISDTSDSDCDTDIDSDGEGEDLIYFLAPGDSAKIIESPFMELKKDDIVKIQGSVMQIWGFTNVWCKDLFKAYRIDVLKNYLSSMPPCEGVIYCGEYGGKYYCFHESWLEKVEEKKS